MVVRAYYQNYEKTYNGAIKFQNKTFTWEPTDLSLKDGLTPINCKFS